MITRVEVLNYRMLRDVSQPLDRFRILVGPNASGKSTFLDVLRFVSDVVLPERGPAGAVEERCRDIRELLWAGEGSEVQVALEVRPPAELLRNCADPVFRYEIAVGCPPEGGPARLNAEALFFYPDADHLPSDERNRTLFPEWRAPRSTALEIDTGRRSYRRQRVVSKTRDTGRDYYQWRPPGYAGKPRWNQSFAVGRERAALFFLPSAEEDQDDYYAAPRWIAHFLAHRIVPVQLDVRRMREASAPLLKGPFRPDGSNLPWLVKELQDDHAELRRDWLAHIRTVLPGIRSIDAVEREQDRHCYLVVHYDPDLRVPGWLVSDGTLRLIGLTLLAYYPFDPSVFLIEEPENGLHPRAVDGVYQVLSSMWEHQVFVASHSPVLLRLAEPSQVLCFSSPGESATDIEKGERHPRLQDWREGMDLADLHAMGVLA